MGLHLHLEESLKISSSFEFSAMWLMIIQRRKEDIQLAFRRKSHLMTTNLQFKYIHLKLL